MRRRRGRGGGLSKTTTTSTTTTSFYGGFASAKGKPYPQHLWLPRRLTLRGVALVGAFCVWIFLVVVVRNHSEHSHSSCEAASSSSSSRSKAPPPPPPPPLPPSAEELELREKLRIVRNEIDVQKKAHRGSMTGEAEDSDSQVELLTVNLPIN